MIDRNKTKQIKLGFFCLSLTVVCQLIICGYVYYKNNVHVESEILIKDALSKIEKVNFNNSKGSDNNSTELVEKTKDFVLESFSSMDYLIHSLLKTFVIIIIIELIIIGILYNQIKSIMDSDRL